MIPRLDPCRIRGLFDAVVELPADERQPYLDEHCPSPELRQRVERLLDVDAAATPANDPPERIGRYRIEKILGEGGFGRVYLAHDEKLHRRVAIKVPRRERLSKPEAAEAYLAEARVLASLDHPHIVPVHDAGTTPDGLCYVVSKLIEGHNLAKAIWESRPAPAQAAGLIATVAEALHYAHRHGVVHRDIKPGNILLDAAGTPYVADFGLALKEADFGKGAAFAGTPAYMSPEQARREGHRVDGRSDIFSLGVVYYELLVGRRPFQAASRDELLEQIITVEARPLRQIDDRIPKELERICLKALAKRASERYPTAKDIADDLRHFLSQQSAPTPDMPSPTPPLAGTSPPTPSSGNRPLKIVPKGLRSFDAHDASFFLELLPGPRDREDLPDSIRFWKTRIEDKDAEKTFDVGLICGPSGCGKSSLVKAGLLPCLSDAIIAVYVEATAEETEARLLNRLRNRCPSLAPNLPLKGTLAALRRGEGIPVGKKVLIVLDQFEQWLHAKKDEENTELVQALRQCDGVRLQTIVMVRDDFWMAVIRFMRELETRLVEGQNSAAVDLFPMRHAEKVLAAFGRAFGCLPEKVADTTNEQKQFLEKAVSGLAREGKVICVRLSLFAEMMKGKSWTPASLKAVGGTEGVGVTFLEETFSATTAPPEHRYHQKAARAVLNALLPESGTDIKGTMRSRAELLEASGYKSRPKDFDDLIRILDGEIRLLTPTDPEGQVGEESSTKAQASAKYYQLTHDYLVPSLRDWLTGKQKETRRGRAELALADRAAVWSARPENRLLPSLWQWLAIRSWTVPKAWTDAQRKMMRRANRYFLSRGVALAFFLMVLTLAGLAIRGRVVEHNNQTTVAERVQGLLDANIAAVPKIVADMAPYRAWADPLLRAEYAAAPAGSSRKLHAGLALLPVDPSHLDYLYGRLLGADAHQISVVIELLAPHKDQLRDKLWQAAEAPERDKEYERLRAASALAKYDPQSAKWPKVTVAVVNDFVAVPAVHVSLWMKPLRDVRKELLTPLSAVFCDANRRDERRLATEILADYAADEPLAIADLLMDADAKQFSDLYPIFQKRRDEGTSKLEAEIDRKLPPYLPSSDERRDKLAKRQANAAVALLKMNRPEKVWPLLEHSPDPRGRSYLIHRFGPSGADARAIIQHLHKEEDLSIRRALILSLGEFDAKAVSPEDRQTVRTKLRDFWTDPDPGLHSAAVWLLSTWLEDDKWLEKTNKEWAKAESSNKRLEEIKRNGAQRAKTPQFYVNGQGQTMIVIPPVKEFLMGSPTTETNRDDRVGRETQHEIGIGRTIVVADKAVTMEQFEQFKPGYRKRVDAQFRRKANLPVVGVDWYEAAAYCNWLSEKEGIDKNHWCYEKDKSGKVTKIKMDYWSLTGYRLPTEAEFEYVTRAGAATSRYFGETEELLPKYAWCKENSMKMTWPVGSLKPNDWGFFDVYGISYWCQNSHEKYPYEDRNNLDIMPTTLLVLRGGGFMVQAEYIRSALRSYNPPTAQNNNNTFRPARTLIP